MYNIYKIKLTKRFVPEFVEQSLKFLSNKFFFGVNFTQYFKKQI